MRKTRSGKEWRELIKEQKTCGKSVALFCREKGLHPNTFYRKVKLTRKPGPFVQLQTADACGAHGSVEIRSGDIIIRLERPFEEAELVRILGCLQEARNAAVS